MIFSDDCPGCRPAMIDFETMKPVPPDSPLMRPINAIWDKTSYEDRQAFHRFTCLGSMELADLMTVKALQQRMQRAATDSGK